MSTSVNKIRVLMVCLGNICRSPTAEAMLRKKVHEAGLDQRIEVDSAGTADYHVGSPPDRRAVTHGERRGLQMKSLRGRQARGRRLRPLRLHPGDGRGQPRRSAPAAAGGVARRARAADVLRAASGRSAEVPDPYYGGADGFERVLDLVDAAAAGFIATVVRIDRFRRPENRFGQCGFRGRSTGRQQQKAHALPRRSIRAAHSRRNR
jgi:protein-tyrosine phosphatase